MLCYSGLVDQGAWEVSPLRALKIDSLSPNHNANCSKKTLKQPNAHKHICAPFMLRARRGRKDPKTHSIVGQPIKRQDVAPKVFAQQVFCTDVKVPGLMHRRG
jgi:hypothetical protein